MDKKSKLNKFVTLLENDVYRSLKLVLPIMALFIILHLVAVILNIVAYKNDFNFFLKQVGDVNDFVFSRGKYSIYRMIRDSGVQIVMAVSFLAVGVYTIILWNREWTGGSKSIYTLLTLPINRTYIIISKVVTMIIFLGVNLFIQSSLLFVDKLLMNIILDSGVIKNTNVLGATITTYRGPMFLDFHTFVLCSMVGISAIMLLTLGVLLFRSFKIKGLILTAIIYGVYGFICVFPMAYFHFYRFEVFYYLLIIPAIVSIISFMWCDHLLKKKVTI